MKNTLKKAYYMACLLVISHTVAWADTTNSVANTPGTTPNYSLLEQPYVSRTWVDTFEDQLDKRVAVNIFDSFMSSQANVRWTRTIGKEGYRANDAYAHAGRSALQHSLQSSIRETIVQSVPGVIESKNWFSRLFVGSLAHTTESSIRPAGITPIAAQMSWWDDTLSKNQVSYGSRAIDGDYLYLDSRFGHWGNDNRSVGVALLRLDGDLFSLQSKAEAQVSFFLPWSSTLTAGVSYMITDLHDSNKGLEWSVGLTHVISKRRYTTSAAYLALSTNTESHALLAQGGLNLFW
ncbi:MAG: hypothetical protein PHG25_02585 [Candidatus Pacebacteria bacterium]|nr:hypothetical protein [Candidatus Paceibacterota bacterium]